MQVNTELPGWVEGRRLHLIAGRETVAIFEPGSGWRVKTVRCNLCGECCREPGQNWPLGTQLIDGIEYCSGVRKVGDEFSCETGYVLWGCLQERVGAKCHPDCVIEYEGAV